MDVYLRIRPPPKSEVATGAVPIVSVHPELGEVTICDPASIGEESRSTSPIRFTSVTGGRASPPPGAGGSTRSFQIDNVFNESGIANQTNHRSPNSSPSTSPVPGCDIPPTSPDDLPPSPRPSNFPPIDPQQTLTTTILPLILPRFTQNLPTTLLLLGPPSSGKSHTLHGPPSDPASGLLPRLLQDIAQAPPPPTALKPPVITLQMTYCYGHTIHDLLSPPASPPDESITLQYNPVEGTYVDARTVVCKDHKNVLAVYESGLIAASWLSGVKGVQFRNGGSLIVRVGRVWEGKGGNTEYGNAVRIVEVGSHVIAPLELDVGDRLKRVSCVGNDYENIKKIIDGVSRGGVGAIKDGYRGSAVGYLCREALFGRTDACQSDARLHNHKTIVVGHMSPLSSQYEENVALCKLLDKVKACDANHKESCDRLNQKDLAREKAAKARGKEEKAAPPNILDNPNKVDVVRGLSREIERVEDEERQRISEEAARILSIEEAERKERKRLGIKGETKKKSLHEKKEEKVKQLHDVEHVEHEKHEKRRRKSEKANGSDSESDVDAAQEELDHISGFEEFDVAVQEKLRVLVGRKHKYMVPIKELLADSKLALDSRASWFKKRYSLQIIGKEKELLVPYLVQLDMDSLFSGRARYMFETGKTTIGRKDATTVINLCLGGAGVDMVHCEVTNSENTLFMKATGTVLVNGVQEYDCAIHHGDVVVIGSTHTFVCWNPRELEQNLSSKIEEVKRRALLVQELPSLLSETKKFTEHLVMDFLRSERRHWRGMETSKNKLNEELTRCDAILTNVEEGKVDGSNIDVDHLEDNKSDCEMGLLDLELYKTQHVTQIENKVAELHYMFQEANEIAEELEKFLSFELCLVHRGGPGVDEPAQGAVDDQDEEKKEEAMKNYMEMLSNGLDIDELNLNQYEAFPGEFWVKVKNTSGENPEELWHMHKFMNRLELMRGMFSTYVDVGRDLVQLAKVKPPDVDPFYEPPTDSLIGVAYCFLDALSYLVEIHESITIINFKGQLVGELEVALSVEIDGGGGVEKEVGDDGEVDFTSEEFVIADHVGETLRISITIKTAKGVPRRQCSGVFVSFPFFLQNVPFNTTRCNKATVNPWFNETFGVQQVITEDFIGYLSHNAMEIELWGAPESLVKVVVGEGGAGRLVGVPVGLDENVGGEEEVALDEDDVDVAYLHEKLEDLEHELKVVKEVGKRDHGLMEEKERERVKELEAERVRVGELEARIEREKAEWEKEKLEMEKKLESKVCTIA